MAIKVRANERLLKFSKESEGEYRYVWLRSTSVSDVTKVSTDLITSRRVIFTPSTDIKQELHNTSISITCYDRNGNIVKQVTSTDPGTVEDPEQEGNDQNTGSNTGGSTGGNTGDSNGGNSGDYDDDGLDKN